MTKKELLEIIGDNEFVDLGLPSGTLWCSRNVGANSATDFGDYFAWGEVETKRKFTWESYAFGDPLTKYNKKDGTTRLDTKDDASVVHLGCVMPTEEQCEELVNTCEYQWVDVDDVKGALFKGKPNKEGKVEALFIPATGYVFGGSVYNVGRYGYYWSSSICSGNPYCTHCLYFNSDDAGVYNGSRCYGQSVRGVKKDSFKDKDIDYDFSNDELISILNEQKEYFGKLIDKCKEGKERNIYEDLMQSVLKSLDICNKIRSHKN